MTYVFDSSASDANRVVLRRSGRVHMVMRAVMLIVAMPLVVAGLVTLFVLSWNHPAPWVLVGSGIGLASFCELVSTQFRAPRRLVFDNQRRQLLIDEAGHEDAAVVPYADIEGFRWLPYASLSAAGHGSPAAMVEMTKRNGAVWLLSRLPSQNDAKQMANALRSGVTLEGSPAPSTTPKPTSNRIRVETKGTTTTIHWKRRYSIVQAALLFGSTLGLTIAIAGARTLLSTYLYYGALSCACVLALLGLYSLSSVAFRSRRVVITDNRLRAYCAGRIGRTSIPLRRIDAVVFHFAPSQRDTLFVLREQEWQRLMELTRGQVTFTDALAAKALSSKVARIEVGDLTMPEKLNLERLLRELIAQHGGHVVH